MQYRSQDNFLLCACQTKVIASAKPEYLFNIARNVNPSSLKWNNDCYVMVYSSLLATSRNPKKRKKMDMQCWTTKFNRSKRSNVSELTIIYRNIRNYTDVQCLVLEYPMLRTGNRDWLIKNAWILFSRNQGKRAGKLQPIKMLKQSQREKPGKRMDIDAFVKWMARNICLVVKDPSFIDSRGSLIMQVVKRGYSNCWAPRSPLYHPGPRY